MNIGKYFEFEIIKLLENIGYDCNFSLTVSTSCNFKRCIGRVWDNVNWDINKRCTREATHNDLCSLHSKNCASGYVNEYPDEKIVLRAYRKHNKNVDSQIDLNNNNTPKILFSTKKLIFNINLKTKKNIDNNSKMSFESIDDLNDIISAYDTNDFSELRKNVLSDLKKKYNFYVTIAEDRILTKAIQDHIQSKTKSNTMQSKIEILCSNKVKNKELYEKNDIIDDKPNKDTLLLDNMEQVKVIDNEYNEALLYIYYDENTNKLYNDKKNLIGFYRYWIDDDDEVPNECKTKDGKVLHPHTKLPIIEIDITAHGSIYSGLVEGIYREYEYDEEFESFRNTNQILK